MPSSVNPEFCVGTAGCPESDGLFWPRLIKGTLIKRYKRFLADIRLGNGQVVTAHCPNSGSMMGCSEPSRPVYISRSNNPKRRLAYTWEMIEMPSSLVGVNTLVPNRLVKQAIIEGRIEALTGYERVTSEVKCSPHSRLDLALDGSDGKRCFVEVKNCTLVENGVAYFPDAVTARGLKHLKELEEQVRLGNRGVIFFLIQRMDSTAFCPADHIDPAYGRELRSVISNGVEALAYDVHITLERITVNRHIPYEL
ncbi:MAG: DNA/RNA nuclease SfsA [Desulfomonilaceae bacterium]